MTPQAQDFLRRIAEGVEAGGVNNGGGGSGGGTVSTADSTAANQAIQITAEQAIRDRIGASTSPAAGTTNYLLTQLVAGLSDTTPSGVTISQTTPGVTNGVVVNALPTTAATTTLQIAGNLALGSLSGTVGGAGSNVTNAQGIQGVDNGKPVGVAVASLPATAATSTLQTAGNASLTSLAAAIAALGSNSTSAIGVQGVDGGKPVGTFDIGVVSGGFFDRPTEGSPIQYTTGDLVANDTLAANVVPVEILNSSMRAGGSGWISGVRLIKSTANLTNASFRVHFLRGTTATPPGIICANGDNGAFSINGITAIHIGYVDITMNQAFTDGAKGTAAPERNIIGFTSNSGNNKIYALIEARANYLPGSAERFTIAAEIIPGN